MNKKEFTDLLIKRLKEKLGNEYEVSPHTVPKNNGVKLNSITIGKKNQQCKPTIYVDDFFEDYLNGRSFKSITEQILDMFYETNVEQNFNLLEQIKDIDKIYCKFINTSANKTMLSKCPHTEWNDLSIIYYFSFNSSDKEGMKTLTINNDLMEYIKLPLKELHEKAMENTKKQMPGRILGMKSILAKMMGDIYSEQEDETLYILSNKTGLHGAISILQEELLSNFCSSINAETVYLIPSSVHEMLLFTGEMPVTEINNMINEINSAEVPLQEILSNNCYIYNRNLHQISVA